MTAPATPPIMRDVATPPGTFHAGDAWAGYLDSPHAAVPWHGALGRCLEAGAALLPVWVAPLSGYGSATPHHDAEEGLAELRALRPRPDKLVVALDTESRAYTADPHGALVYAAQWNEAVHNAGGHPVHYGSRAFLAALRPHLAHGHAWLAWWTDPATSAWPLPSWPAPHAWQFSDTGHYEGQRVDLSTLEAGFPLCRRLRQPTPIPPPTPTPPPARAGAWAIAVAVRRTAAGVALTASHEGSPPAGVHAIRYTPPASS